MKELFTLDLLSAPPAGALDAQDPQAAAILAPVLRSKGFCWLDNEPLRQHVWAHAGKTMAVQPADWWWAALDKEQLKFKVTYPGVEAEYKMARAQKWDRDVGDRRQELVFIGGPQMLEADIVALLERCLLSDKEYAAFKEKTRGLKVPNDDFHVNGLLKNLGATPEQIKEINAKADRSKEEERLHRKQDREDTEMLCALGVGKDLEPEDEDWPAEDAAGPAAAPPAAEEVFDAID